MRILVTGGNGFIGSHVVERLMAQGHELRLFLRTTSKTEFLDGLSGPSTGLRTGPSTELRTSFERVNGDLRDEASLARGVAGMEAVVHLGGVTAARTEAEYLAVNGEPAGMVGGLPNLYEAIRDFRGFLDPWKALKLLWRLKVRGTETGRVFIFGVRPKFQRRRELYGLPFLLLYELYRAGQERRYRWCEESWVLETNARLNAMMPYWDAYVYKRYRIYEKVLR